MINIFLPCSFVGMKSHFLIILQMNSFPIPPTFATFEKGELPHPEVGPTFQTLKINNLYYIFVIFLAFHMFGDVTNPTVGNTYHNFYWILGIAERLLNGRKTIGYYDLELTFADKIWIDRTSNCYFDKKQGFPFAGFYRGWRESLVGI